MLLNSWIDMERSCESERDPQDSPVCVPLLERRKEIPLRSIPRLNRMNPERKEEYDHEQN
jgi:hypothetical protein